MKEKYLKGLVVEILNCLEVEDYDLAEKYGEKYLRIVNGEEEFVIDDYEV